MLKEKYKNIWNIFVSDLKQIKADYESKIQEETFSLHQELQEIEGIPYHCAHDLISDSNINNNPKNIGSVTGTFFEEAVCMLVLPRIKMHHPDVLIYRNTSNGYLDINLPRDPDLLFHKNGNTIVIEIKRAPKLNDINHIERVRQEHLKCGVQYFFIGGFISINKQRLNDLSKENWLTCMKSSASNKNILTNFQTLDAIVDQISNQL